MPSAMIPAGWQAGLARLGHAPGSIGEFDVDSSRRDKRMLSFSEQARGANVHVRQVASDRLDGLARGTRHQGVVALAQARKRAADADEVLDMLEDKQQKALLLILDGVTDPHNLGACLRTADAAGVHAVIAPRDRAVGLSAIAQRVACGGAEAVPYIMVTNLARTMRSLKERSEEHTSELQSLMRI